jgi:hypothetical protein
VVVIPPHQKKEVINMDAKIAFALVLAVIDLFWWLRK